MYTGNRALFIIPVALLLLDGALSWSAPPRVKSASPDNGDTDVDPATTELRIEFDQDMSQAGHSLCGGGDAFPKITGNMRWDNRRTAIIPISLEPEHDYQLSINCNSFRKFAGASGESAVPYPVAFRTGAAGARAATPAPTTEQNAQAIAALQRALNERYSYRDLHGVNWNAAIEKATDSLTKSETAIAFGRGVAKLLEQAKDIHITVKVGTTTLPTRRTNGTPNCNVATLARLVPGWTQHNRMLATGRFEDGIGYAIIGAWDKSDPTALDPLFRAFDDWKDAPGIIIDVRPNGGGDEPLAQTVAGCFVQQKTVYAKNDYRDTAAKGGFGTVHSRAIEPNKDRPALRCKVAVLMGPLNVSSCESFLLMMRHGAKARLFGAKSYGSSGNPQPADLGNGVIVMLPSWRSMLPNGDMLEGQGIKPDVAVRTTAETLKNKDPVLQAALEWLRSKPSGK